MTFEEWWESPQGATVVERTVAKSAWDYQQVRIDELEEELKVLRDDDALTIAYMKGFSDAKAAQEQ